MNLEIQAGFFRRRVQDVTQGKGLELDERLQVWNLRGYAADYRSFIPRIRDIIKDERYARVVLDPTYKILGSADENSATDIAALLNAVENLAVSSGAAVAMAGHFAKAIPRPRKPLIASAAAASSPAIRIACSSSPGLPFPRHLFSAPGSVSGAPGQPWSFPAPNSGSVNAVPAGPEMEFHSRALWRKPFRNGARCRFRPAVSYPRDESSVVESSG